ncbi:glutathione S-transferase-like [Vicia villosa]|uniref:glutathione S-transferase-like n=1 Tax=Vicia villosa TaxID=3911 RepID=UPI00273B20B2|nr:glutathione S-transferase-like [Vicia villosa]
MATPVKVYGPAFSPTVSRVLTCLNEKDIQFQLVPVNMSKGEHRSPNFLKIHPFAQVPAFQDDDITLFESRAICRYVCEKHIEKGNRELYGTNPLAKASIDQWLEAEGQSFNPPSSTLVFQLAFAPRMNVKQDEGVINQSKEKLKRVLDVYDRKLGETRYLAGDEFTLADLSHLPNIHYLVGTDDDTASLFTSERENVTRWWTEISTRESWKKVVDLYPKP